LSCFVALNENAVVKMGFLTYWGLREGILEELDSSTTEEQKHEKIFYEIFEEFQAMG
jgi:hypothetical protein